jgi:hypothetical protein
MEHEKNLSPKNVLIPNFIKIKAILKDLAKLGHR